MDKNFNIIFSKTQCPDSETLYKYAKGNLSIDLNRKIEAHLADCEMCSDEVEGWSMLKNKDEISEIINRINRKVEKRIKRKNIPINLGIGKIYAVAALILLLLSLTFVVTQYFVNSFSDTAQNLDATEQKSDKINPQKEVSVVEKSNNSETKIMTEAETEKAKVNSDKDIIISPVLSDIAPDEISEEIISSDTISVISEEFDEVVITESISKTETADSKAVNLKEKSDDKSSDENVFASLSRNSDEKSFKKDSNRNKAFASEAADNISGVESPENQSAKLYYEGFEFYSEKKYTEAIEKFNKVLELKSMYFEEAQWYKALSFVESGQKDKAVNILHAIFKAGGKFSAPAAEKLNEIN